MSVREKLEILLPTQTAINTALLTLILAAFPIPFRGVFEEFLGVSTQTAAQIAVVTALSTLLAGTFICLVSVICHCREQERKIAALEEELRAQRTLVAHKNIHNLVQTQDFGRMLDRHYLVNDRL